MPLRLAPADGKCHKWVGIALNAASDLEGGHESLHRQRVHRPSATTLGGGRGAGPGGRDGRGTYLLGRSRSRASRASRQAASLIFGAPLLSATFEQALEHFERAETIDPGFWKKNTAMVGEALLKLGWRAEAKEWLQKAAAIATVHGDRRGVRGGRRNCNAPACCRK